MKQQIPDQTWQRIKTEYIYGIKIAQPDGLETIEYPTYKELGEKYDVNYITIGSKGCRQKWTEAREINAKKLQEQITTYNYGVLNDYGVQNDIKTIRRLEDLDEIIDNAIEVAKVSASIDQKTINGLLDAVGKSHRYMREALGEREKKSEYKAEKTEERKVLKSAEIAEIELLLEGRTAQPVIAKRGSK